MTQDLLLALQITVIGMGLVFGSIILFWLIMAALVRLTRPGIERPLDAELRQGNLPDDLPSEIVQHPDQRESKALLGRRAAVAAVAVALAQRRDAAQPSARPASSISAWQVVQRAKGLRIFPQRRGSVR